MKIRARRSLLLMGGLSMVLFLPAAGFAQQCGDVDCSGTITATDALRVLKKAVGQSVTLRCGSDCLVVTTTSTSTSTPTSSSTVTTTTLPPLPQDTPCLCGADCPFVCPDKTMTSGVCVIEQTGLLQGQCRCTAICSGQLQLCPMVCDQSACSVSCPGGSNVPGECDTGTFDGCLCSNQTTAPCP